MNTTALKMVERTEHGEERHEDIERPTSEAEQDKAAASEIYFDIESEYYVFVGEKGRRIFLLQKVCITRVSNDKTKPLGASAILKMGEN